MGKSSTKYLIFPQKVLNSLPLNWALACQFTKDVIPKKTSSMLFCGKFLFEGQEKPTWLQETRWSIYMCNYLHVIEHKKGKKH
jgi:hypothetical protein